MSHWNITNGHIHVVLYVWHFYKKCWWLGLWKGPLKDLEDILRIPSAGHAISSHHPIRKTPSFWWHFFKAPSLSCSLIRCSEEKKRSNPFIQLSFFLIRWMYEVLKSVFILDGIMSFFVLLNIEKRFHLFRIHHHFYGFVERTLSWSIWCQGGSQTCNWVTGC